MLRLNFWSVVLVLFAGALIGVRDSGAAERSARVPVLLELFTSEGCSSCPPADRLLELLDRKQPVPGAEVIVLSEHVDYWDHLGWKDPFSSLQFSVRQQEYTSKYHFDGVYTPQLVVDGRFGFVGSDEHAAASAIREVMRQEKIAVVISNAVRENQVKAHIEVPAAEGLRGVRPVLFVAVALDRAESQVTRGENAGRPLTHVAVARELKEVITIDLNNVCSKDITLPVPPKTAANGLRLVAFVQDLTTGHVLGVAARRL